MRVRGGIALKRSQNEAFGCQLGGGGVWGGGKFWCCMSDFEVSVADVLGWCEQGNGFHLENVFRDQLETKTFHFSFAFSHEREATHLLQSSPSLTPLSYALIILWKMNEQSPLLRNSRYVHFVQCARRHFSWKFVVIRQPIQDPYEVALSQVTQFNSGMFFALGVRRSLFTPLCRCCTAL